MGGLPAVKHSYPVFTFALAQMRGWQTRRYAEKKFIHHRTIGTAVNNIFHSRFKYGLWDYYAGNHPLWELFRGFYQMTEKPYFIGGMLILCGYLWGLVLKEKAPVSSEIFTYIRQRQLGRLKSALFRSRSKKI